jgi:hypothetical protein
MTTYAYNKDISKWGDLADAILKKDDLVQLFDDEGIFKEELEEVSKTEKQAETADNNQNDATQQISELTPKVNAAVVVLLELFDKLRLKIPNVIDDLKKAKDLPNMKAASDLDFSHKTIPRLPKSAGDTAEETDEVVATLDGEAKEETEEVQEKRNNAQRAVSTVAKRLSTYLSTKPGLVAALKKRKMPDTFVEDFMSKGIELGELRDLRVLALAKQKEATRAEHQAVEEHMTARKKVEPTATKLSRTNRALDALLVEHLGRKSLHTNQSTKKAPAKAAKTTKSTSKAKK